VLFLDEPTVGLDPIARDAVWKHLVDLRANYGTTRPRFSSTATTCTVPSSLA
jgi:ABC-type transporter Mla maintaining outer membrane lipid asymmetry ATPase subunit MlaF